MKVAIIGYGRMAKEYIKVLDHLGVNICCIMKQTEIEEGNIPVVYSIHDLFLFYPDALIVAISHENTFYFLMNKRLIDSNIPMLIEKPVAFTEEEFEELNYLYENKDVFVGYNRRFYDGIEMLRHKIEFSNSLNNLKSIYINLTDPIKMYERAGVKLLENFPFHYSASHIIDLLFYLLNDNIRIKYNDGKVIVAKTIVNKIPILIRVSFDSPEFTTMTFKFKDDILYEFSPIENLTIYKGITKNKDGVYEREVVTQKREDFNFKPGLLNEVNEVKNFLFYDGIGKLATLEDASKVSAFCNKMKEGM